MEVYIVGGLQTLYQEQRLKHYNSVVKVVPDQHLIKPLTYSVKMNKDTGKLAPNSM